MNLLKQLATYEKLVWVLFLIWSLAGLCFTGLKITDTVIETWNYHPTITSFLKGCLSWGDFIFLSLAALNLYFVSITLLGAKKTWVSFLIICFASGIIEIVGTLTGFPFGDYHYTTRMGPLLFSTLPLAIPFSWYLIVVGGFFCFGQFFPQRTHTQLAFFTACFALFVDWIMEPFAWKIKGYWIWAEGSVPIENYIAWFVLSFFFARFTPINEFRLTPMEARPRVILSIMIGLFVLNRFVHGI